MSLDFALWDKTLDVSSKSQTKLNTMNVAKDDYIISPNSVTVILTLKIAKQSLHMTLIWLLVAHCHTRFGYKGLSCSEDIIRTNIN